MYRRLAGSLSGHLENIGHLVVLPKLTQNQERDLRASIRQVAMRVAYDLEKYHGRKNRRAYRGVDAAVSRFERTFGHPPGDVALLREGKVRTEHTCIGVAQGIAGVLAPFIPAERLGVVRLDGPEQAHPSIVLSAANGREYVADNWGLDRRSGAYTLDEFKESLLSCIGRKRHPLFALSDALGLHVWKQPAQALSHPQAMLRGGLKLLSASAHENLAWQHMEAGDDAKALAAANRAIQIFPESNLAFMRRGDIHLNNGRYRRAIADYRRALDLFPHNALALENMAFSYRYGGDERAMRQTHDRLAELVTFKPIELMRWRSIVHHLEKYLPDVPGGESVPIQIRVTKTEEGKRKKGAFFALEQFLDRMLEKPDSESVTDKK